MKLFEVVFKCLITRLVSQTIRESMLPIESPNEDFGRRNKMMKSEFYAPQTKILEGGTKDEIQIFD